MTALGYNNGPLALLLVSGLLIGTVLVGAAHTALSTIVPGWVATLTLATPIAYGANCAANRMAESVRGETA